MSLATLRQVITRWVAPCPGSRAIPGSAWHSALWIALWSLVAVSSLLFVPLFPIDETRYAGVAWEMWLREDFILPTLNGEPYSHKPPLLFWLIHLGWAIFGVNEWWLRLMPALFALAAVFLTRRLARQLWPEGDAVARLAPAILLATALWLSFIPMLMFDIALGCWVLLAVTGLCQARETGGYRGWLLFAIATTLGILTKGPVMLLHVLPPALLLPRMAARPGARPPRWYGPLAVSLVVAVAAAMLWAVPAALRGGPEYAQAILWGQSSGRVVDSFAHRAAWWLYIALLPVILFPWLWWPPLWKGVRHFARNGRADPSLRFCVIWMALVFLAFSLISGKRVHYLVPLMPVFSLVVARILGAGRAWRIAGSAQWPVAAAFVALAIVFMVAPRLQPRTGWHEWVSQLPWSVSAVLLLGAVILLTPWRPLGLTSRVLQIACVLVVAFSAVKVQVIGLMRPYYDLHRISAELRQGEDRQMPIALVGKYHNQYNFFGRLVRPLQILRRDELPAWVARNTTGLIVTYHEEPPEGAPRRPRAYYPYRGRWAAIWAAEEIVADPALLDFLGNP